MQKFIIFLLSTIFIIVCYFTMLSAMDVFQSDWKMPKKVENDKEKLRLVLITQDLETPFWDQVARGVRRQAEKEDVNIDVWGSYDNNKEDFLKKIEVAIHSKVDGIIVQGLDTKEFIEMTKIKAPFYGVPIVTVANDVPMNESLRKTYVGSNQVKAGQMIAKKLVSDMGTSGKIVLLYDQEQKYYQNERLKGIQQVLEGYPNIEIIHAKAADTREQIINTTQDFLNQVPDVDAVIAVNANAAGPMVQEMSKRIKVEPIFLYSFDDGPETLSLLIQRKLDGIIQQEPEKMGIVSVQKLIEWLKGETVPLDINGYFTNIRVVESEDVQ